MMTAEEIEERFGISQAQVEEWSAAWERGELPGEPVGEVTYGRPLKFGEPLQVVTFKDTEQHVSAMDRRASDLGLKRSDYLRWLISQDLAAAGFASESCAHRTRAPGTCLDYSCAQCSDTSTSSANARRQSSNVLRHAS